MNFPIGMLLLVVSGSGFAMDCPQAWNPLTYQTKCAHECLLEIKSEQKAQQFLAKVPTNYAIMRANVEQHPEFFSRDFFERFSQEHVTRLKNIIKMHGWPNFDEQSAQAAWTIAQQATEDPEFQEEALLHLDKLLTDSEQAQKTFLRTHFAYLYDLVQINKGKEQFYGTACDKQGFIRPIKGYLPHLLGHEKNLELVNQRRAQMGLNSLQDYKLELDLLFALARLNDSKVALPSCVSTEHQSLTTQATDQDCQTSVVDSLPDSEPQNLCSPSPLRPPLPILLADSDLQPS